MTTKKQFFTTPIYYVNAKPHLGHAYTSIATDVATRFKQMDNHETFFLTGTDEHGDKIVQAAQAQGNTPKEYADQISTLFQNLLPKLNVKNNHFIRTTDPDHINVVKKVLSKIYDSGDIYFSNYEGLYCFGCERFYQERELTDGKCPDHGKAPTVIKESNYFFKMSKYQEWLINHIKTNPDFIRPAQYKKELLSFLKEPLEDLCISRPKSRLTWGITLPFDEDYVTYVWFDALVNYISALGYPDGELFKKFWADTRHFVAKDIIKPHGIYWPIMLKAAGIPIYKGLNVHGFWNVKGSKMSKSIGNVTDPVKVTDIYGIDSFRYFLMREMVFGLDANFTEETIISRINADLANDLGNTFSRILSMNLRYFDGEVKGYDSKIEKDKGLSLSSDASLAIDEFKKAMELCEFHKGIGAIWQFISTMNKYIDKNKPWALAKDEANIRVLETILYNLVEGLRVVSCLIYPIMPQTSFKMQKALSMEKENKGFYTLDEISAWGQVKKGTLIAKPDSLFPRIEKDKIKPKETAGQTKMFKPALKEEITIDDFAKIDLRTGTVISAEKIEKSNKLLKLKVDLGAQTRQIIAGIAKNYNPDQIIGKQVIVVANLKEATLMGETSQGMILATDNKKKLVLSGFDKEILPGNPVK
ncbi:methionine--tRNA ligase [Desulfobacula sp.]|jgi:methionyl-tRNA synthetase|uniref:methionine--tRNA ligase n=1 Tax=Desulfobacula sp. TaxID=2593537 RepID=UPI001E0C0E43|nr:methionine--tRNA ligase [Desulfobacula sp.]MBT4025345.1 methionine--tRNA ligase [Desulfobacula sp.]MBT4199503.1 methionine--tRNA ligase [Desulfobacula sp.]MBT4506352.1 methionine--tRNA ligase [Desulfobacula sp.]